MHLGLIAFAFVFVEGLHLLTPLYDKVITLRIWISLNFSDPGSVSSESESEANPLKTTSI